MKFQRNFTMLFNRLITIYCYGARTLLAVFIATVIYAVIGYLLAWGANEYLLPIDLLGGAIYIPKFW